MKQRLIILSDLWGLKNTDWITNYTSNLETHFNIKFYDCCELGLVNNKNNTEQNIHSQFINGGIDRAVHNLLKKETNPIHILAFSIGGTIAWNSGLSDLKIDNLFAVSATRLRYENEKPNCMVTLKFGELDQNKPSEQWHSNFNINEDIIPNKNHNLYMNSRFAIDLCSEIMNTLI